jgi:hypothetical protein
MRVVPPWPLLAALRVLLLAGLAASWEPPTTATAQSAEPPPPAVGCRPELGELGAQIMVQILQPGPAGDLTALGPAAAVAEARSGQVIRVLVRPVAGSAQPNGAGCPVRVRLDGLVGVGRLRDPGGFVFDGELAYALLGPGEARALDFAVKPFDEWDPANDHLEIEQAVVKLPETAEFIARLPAPFRPPAGTVCAEVVYPDAQPAVGVSLALVAPPTAPPEHRSTGDDGQVCWDGFGESRYGDLILDPAVDSALGQPRSRYVSREASYRLFVVRRPR